MDKAEQRALEAYPVNPRTYVNIFGDIELDDNGLKRRIYIEGYHQAVNDLTEQLVQYDSVESAIKAHASTYSFNIESKLFNQLTKEQQALWRKEIEQACISGGEVGVELARDIRYKENIETKEEDLEKEIIRVSKNGYFDFTDWKSVARHFYELGLNTRKERINMENKRAVCEKEKGIPRHQLTKEQQALWRKEIEEASANGEYCGLELYGSNLVNLIEKDQKGE